LLLLPATLDARAELNLIKMNQNLMERVRGAKSINSIPPADTAQSISISLNAVNLTLARMSVSEKRVELLVIRRSKLVKLE
jgi:hypothetical protein